jgi:hypothetical protein
MSLFFFIIGVSLVVLALLLTLGSVKIEAVQLTSDQSIMKNIQFVIYENPTYGFRIDFPKLWEFEVAENGSANPVQVVYFYSSPDDENLSGDFTVDVEKLRGEYSIQDYVADTVDQYRSHEGFKLISYSLNNTLGGLRAYSILYNQNYNSTVNLTTLEVGTIRGNLVYFIEYYAFDKEFNQNIPIARKMIDSIGFINSGYGQSNLTYGPPNSDHQHASFAVVLNNSTIDFSQNKYQLRSPLIHVENKEGKTLHRHASNIPLIHFFNTLGMNIIDNCFVLDNGTKYCSNNKMKLTFYLNGQQVNSINDYVVRNGDEILILYGNDSLPKIRDRLIMLNQAIKPLFPK